ncbi:MAG: hypothetical protein JSR98_20170 [Proteobacteria bacterium]|nr:hypothetical protein [Pseudomonadota bacterium]
MNRRRHATLSRLLIEACGGLAEAAGVCRVGKSQLSDYQNPQGEGFMPADVMVALEAHCGQPIYSRAIAEANPAREAGAGLLAEACDAVELASGVQRRIRLATSGGELTPRLRAEIGRQAEGAREAMEALVEDLSGAAGSGG